MQRAYGLDVLRGAAMLMVLLVHIDVLPLWRHLDHDAVLALMPWFNVKHMGMWGIDIFFVLSGFLVASMLMNEARKNGRIDFMRFWLRRGLKVWPAYFLGYSASTALLCLLIFRKEGLDGISQYWSTAWVNLVFIQNYVNMDSRWFASWSLAVEEQFYLMLPLLLIVMMKMAGNLRWLPALCLAGITVSVTLRLDAAQNEMWDEIWRQTHLRMDSLICGVLLGYLHATRQGLWTQLQAYRWGLLIVGLAGILVQYPFMDNTRYIMSWGMLFVALSGACLLMFFIGLDNDLVRNNRLLRFLRKAGLYSYSIYICQSFGHHFYVLDRYTKGTALEQWPVGAVVFLTISVGLGLILHRLIEYPVLLIRDRYMPSKGSPLGETPSGGGEVRMEEQRVSP